jgi:hypothetical protein
MPRGGNADGWLHNANARQAQAADWSAGETRAAWSVETSAYDWQRTQRRAPGKFVKKERAAEGKYCFLESYVYCDMTPCSFVRSYQVLEELQADLFVHWVCSSSAMGTEGITFGGVQRGCVSNSLWCCRPA